MKEATEDDIKRLTDKAVKLREKIIGKIKPKRNKNKIADVIDALDGVSSDAHVRGFYLDQDGDLEEDLEYSLGDAPFRQNPNWDVWSISVEDGQELIGECSPFEHHAATQEDLENAIRDACAERARFYKEREELYGASAWPRSA